MIKEIYDIIRNLHTSNEWKRFNNIKYEFWDALENNEMHKRSNLNRKDLEKQYVVKKEN